MARRKVKKEADDYHTASPLIYNGEGEYIMLIPARDLSSLDVVETAAKLDMSVGEFTGMVTIKAKNKRGEALYIVLEESTPPKKIKIKDNDNKEAKPTEVESWPTD